MLLKPKKSWLIPSGMAATVLVLIGVNIYLAVHVISEGLKETPQDAIHAKDDMAPEEQSETNPDTGPHAMPDIVPDRPPVPAEVEMIRSVDGAFTRDRSLQASGYYKLPGDAPSQMAMLTELKLGPAADFSVVEKIGLDRGHAAPFVLVFTVPTSATGSLMPPLSAAKTTEVVCRRYTLTRGEVSCEGFDKSLGKVTFHGKFSQGFITKIAVTGDSTAFYDEGAIIGAVTVNDLMATRYNVSLAYWKEE